MVAMSSSLAIGGEVRGCRPLQGRLPLVSRAFALRSGLRARLRAVPHLLAGLAGCVSSGIGRVFPADCPRVALAGIAQPLAFALFGFLPYRRAQPASFPLPCIANVSAMLLASEK